jgi:hypothetical protein
MRCKVFVELDRDRTLKTYWVAEGLKQARGYCPNNSLEEVPPETLITVGYGDLSVVPLQLRFRMHQQEVPYFPLGVTLRADQWAEIHQPGLLAWCRG